MSGITIGGRSRIDLVFLISTPTPHAGPEGLLIRMVNDHNDCAVYFFRAVSYFRHYLTQSPVCPALRLGEALTGLGLTES